MVQDTETLVRWLRDAHAMERATIGNLDRLQGRFGRYPQFVTRLQQHWIESQDQAARLERSLNRLGAEPSAIKDTTTRLLGVVESFVAGMSADEVLKDCIATYAFEHFEIACYISLAAAARAAEEPEIERMCEEHLQQERAMADWLEQRIPEVTQDYLGP